MSEDGEIDVESDGVPDGFEVSGTERGRHVSDDPPPTDCVRVTLVCPLQD